MLVGFLAIILACGKEEPNVTPIGTMAPTTHAYLSGHGGDDAPSRHAHAVRDTRAYHAACTNPESCCDGYSGPDCNSHADSYTGSNGDRCPDCNSHADSYTGSNGDRCPDCNSHADSYTGSNGDRCPDCNSHADSYTGSNGDRCPDCNSHADSYTGSNGDRRPDCNSHAATPRE